MLDFAIETARKAGAYICGHEKFNVERKGRIDLVTDVDKGSEEIIVAAIKERFPEHSVLAEEGGANGVESDYQWVIDPIDGTTNFVHGLPLFCVSIALYNKGIPQIGVCFNPARDELFYAERGRGAYLNGKSIFVSDEQTLVDSLVVTGFPYDVTEIDPVIDRFKRVVKKAGGVRRLGSAAIDICYVAAGYLDGYWETSLRPWDMAGAVVVLTEAGGKISSFDGTDFDINSGEILATNGRIHDELQRCM